MLQEIAITPATVVLMLLIAAWVVWAVRRVLGRGMCDCHDHCGDGGCCGKRGGCGGCGAVGEMVKNMEATAKE